MRYLNVIFVLLSACLYVQGAAGHLELIRDGRPKGNIVLAPDFKEAEAYAAMELNHYLRLLTGALLPVSLNPEAGVCNIYLTRNPAQLPKSVAAQLYRIRDDGFLIASSGNDLFITARKPLGILFGTYEILQKYGGIRWLFPGEEGESYTKMRNFSVPEQMTVVNPSFRIRTFNLTGGPANVRMLKTLQWQLRNKMQPRWFMNDVRVTGGHDFWTLLPKELFRTNPELFPMVNGKRNPPSGRFGDPGYANPCVSNPETMKRICETIVKKLSADRSITRYEILQNDTMQWCECENCARLDSPKEKRMKEVSNRFWIYANAVIAAVREKIPSMEFQSMAYINAENPPDRVKPDPRIDHMKICLVRRCYTHSLGDESCELNRAFRNRIQAWRRLGYPVTTYEYSMFVPQGTQIYTPSEGVLAKDLKYYRKAGIIGYCDERPPLVDQPETFFIRQYLPSLGNSWKYDALPRYVQASLLWNPDADLDSVLEDFGSRYYENAWPAMKQYRALLRKGYENSGSHFQYGSPNVALGRCLENKEDHAALKALLKQAFRLAEGNAKIIGRLRLDQDGLDGWEIRRKEYEKIAELNTPVRRISGEPDEEDWRKTPEITGFQALSAKQKIEPTFVRVLASDQAIYFRIRASEPFPGEMIARKTRRDDKIWEDNGMEIFLAPPALGGKYLHLALNSKGVLFDAMTLHATDSDPVFDSRAEIRTGILPDGWTAQIKIPYSALGGKPALGDAWKVNIARNRIVTGKPTEASSWSGGVFHGYDSWRSLIFSE